MLFLSLAESFQNLPCQKFFLNYHQSDKQFLSRSGRHFVGPDLYPNCLQKLSALQNTLAGQEFF